MEFIIKLTSLRIRRPSSKRWVIGCQQKIPRISIDPAQTLSIFQQVQCQKSTIGTRGNTYQSQRTEDSVNFYRDAAFSFLLRLSFQRSQTSFQTWLISVILRNYKNKEAKATFLWK